jgi:hypothetical protein
MTSSVHATPDSEPAWVVPPTPSTSAERPNTLRASSAPEYGVAASSVSLISRIGGASAPEIATGVRAGAFHVEQGALYQAFPQVSNGAERATRSLSASTLANGCGHGVSVHWTAR